MLGRGQAVGGEDGTEWKSNGSAGIRTAAGHLLRNDRAEAGVVHVGNAKANRALGICHLSPVYIGRYSVYLLSRGGLMTCLLGLDACACACAG